MTLAWIALAVFGALLVEAVRAARNEAVQRRRGGIEPAGDVYRLMRIAYPAAFLAMIVEGVVVGGPPATLRVGAAVFVIAKALKWWAIGSLGRSWTFRVIVVPGDRLVRTGPYRFMRHPNYVAVVGELAGVALMTGGRRSGLVAIAAFGALMLRRIVVENRALRTMRPPAD